jgi:hypothetical protein
MMNKKWLPHIIAVVSLAVFVVLGLASDGGASTPYSYSSDSYSDSSSEWNLDSFGANSLGGAWSGSVGGSLILTRNIAQFKDSNGNTSSGTATISGNYLNLYFTSGPLAGYEFRYTIVSSKLLQGSGENFSRY